MLSAARFARLILIQYLHSRTSTSVVLVLLYSDVERGFTNIVLR